MVLQSKWSECQAYKQILTFIIESSCSVSVEDAFAIPSKMPMVAWTSPRLILALDKLLFFKPENISTATSGVAFNPSWKTWNGTPIHKGEMATWVQLTGNKLLHWKGLVCYPCWIEMVDHCGNVWDSLPSWNHSTCLLPHSHSSPVHFPIRLLHTCGLCSPPCLVGSPHWQQSQLLSLAKSCLVHNICL